MSFLSKSFGSALKKRREELGQSQAAIAESIGAEPPTVSRWETGQFIPGDDLIDRLLISLDWTPEEFLKAMAGVPTASEMAEERAARLLLKDIQERIEALKLMSQPPEKS